MTIYEHGKINSLAVVEEIQRQNRAIFSAQSFFVYEGGVYNYVEREKIQRIILELVGSSLTKSKMFEIITFLQTKVYIPESELNNSQYLNLKNGLFDINTYELVEHTPDEYSTIQMNVEHDPDALCPLWEKSLSEIFMGNQDKIQLLQEYFGLCLTRENRYAKALFLLGEGANGKSMILEVLSELLGTQNTSSIPFEKFDNHHYLASLFGKLVNISSETNAKSGVYDSNFKSIVSGDEIQADQKFKKPFKFRPFCKLIFALNNMPRVDDKTDGFFRRLLIIRFDRQFSEREQDKQLASKLKQELSGIFNWSLEGLQRLRERGYFDLGQSIQTEINQYKKDNNNVLVFVDECCSLGLSLRVTVARLYLKYKDWCEDNGCYPLSKINFGKQFQKCFPNDVTKEKESAVWMWRGVDLQ